MSRICLQWREAQLLEAQGADLYEILPFASELSRLPYWEKTAILQGMFWGENFNTIELYLYADLANVAHEDMHDHPNPDSWTF